RGAKDGHGPLVATGFRAVKRTRCPRDQRTAGSPRGRALLRASGLRRLVGLVAFGRLRRGVAAARRLLLARLRLAAGAIDQLDHGERRGVAGAHAEPHDTRAAALPALVAARPLVAQLLQDRATVDEGRRSPPGVQAALLAERDHAIAPALELLRLGVGRADGLVLEERGDEVPEERAAMCRRPVELHACDAMAHG